MDYKIKPKVCVYAIALNEEHHVDRFMDGCTGADYVVVCDTGSTDKTAEKLKNRGAIVHQIKVVPWRFDVARNTALSLVPQDADLCLTVDLDEILQPGWRDSLDELWEKTGGTVTRVQYHYVWNWKNGEPDIQFIGDRFHSRNNYIWKHPCHETVYWCGHGSEKIEKGEGLQLFHFADNSKSRGQYLPLLKKAVEEDPNNDRMHHYYARELYFYDKYQEAIDQLNKYLTLFPNAWKQERAASYGYIAKSYRKLGDYDSSIKYAILGTLESGNTREPWLELARAAYYKNDWNTCLWASSRCLSIKEKTMSYISSSDCWGPEPYDLQALSYYNLGQFQQAIESGKLALKQDPTDNRLAKNLEFYTKQKI